MDTSSNIVLYQNIYRYKLPNGTYVYIGGMLYDKEETAKDNISNSRNKQFSETVRVEIFDHFKFGE